MDGKSSKYWFSGKRYGWGWGIPNTWQGWVVLAFYLSVMGGASHFLSPVDHAPAFYAVTLLATLILVLVCLRKGEPPRWRWGKR